MIRSKFWIPRSATFPAFLVAHKITLPFQAEYVWDQICRENFHLQEKLNRLMIRSKFWNYSFVEFLDVCITPAGRRGVYANWSCAELLSVKFRVKKFTRGWVICLFLLNVLKIANTTVNFFNVSWIYEKNFQKSMRNMGFNLILSEGKRILNTFCSLYW